MLYKIYEAIERGADLEETVLKGRGRNLHWIFTKLDRQMYFMKTDLPKFNVARAGKGRVIIFLGLLRGLKCHPDAFIATEFFYKKSAKITFYFYSYFRYRYKLRKLGR